MKIKIKRQHSIRIINDEIHTCGPGCSVLFASLFLVSPLRPVEEHHVKPLDFPGSHGFLNSTIIGSSLIFLIIGALQPGVGQPFMVLSYRHRNPPNGVGTYGNAVHHVPRC